MIHKLTALFFALSLLLITYSGKEVSANIDPDEIFHSRVIPPAPSVSSLGRFGNVPVNLSTGAAAVSIPLGMVTIRNGSLPISLSYSSNGIKVDAIASWVGMEWSLNAGGIISRTVRGGPDENSTCNIPSGLDEWSPNTVNFLQYQWDQTTDTEPDIFTYNFDGHSGKFIVDPNNKLKAYPIPHNNLKIEINYFSTNYEGIYSFQITTPEGVKYLFGENYSDTSKSPVPIGCHYRIYDRGIKTAWHLKKIEYPSGETIDFTYKSKKIVYYTGISQTIRKFIYSACIDPCEEGDEEGPCAQYLTTWTYHLEKITTSGKDSVCFYSSGNRPDSDELKLDSIKIFNSRNALIKNISFDYDYADAHGKTYNGIMGFYADHPQLKYRMFLKELHIAGTSSLQKQNYSFAYNNPDQLPGRLSFSQDHWGFYNGADNYDFVVVPKNLVNHPDWIGIQCDREPNYGYPGYGLLKSITYPTGGMTIFEYENNTFSTWEWVYPDPYIIEESMWGINCYDADTTSIIYTVPITQDQYVGATALFDSTAGCYYSKNRHVGKISVYDTTTSTYLVSQKVVHCGKSLSIPVHYIQNHVYRARIISYGEHTETTFGSSFYLTEPTMQKVQKITGGMRIKRVIDCDNITGKNDTTRYYYGDLSNPNESSGVKGGNPKYSSSQLVKHWCGGVEDDCYFLTLYSNSVNNLYNVNGNCIMYNSVIKSNGENFKHGGEVSTFINDIDEPGYIVSWCDDNILDATKNNDSWNNGLLDQQLSFKYQNNSFIPVKKINYVHSDDTKKDTTFHGFVFRKKYQSAFNQPATYSCTEKDVEKEYWYCAADHKHWWYIPLFGPTICIRPDAVMQKFPHPCQYVGQTIVNVNALDNFEGIRYDIYIKWNHLDNIITKTFSISGQDSITETTSYKYFNADHTLPNLIKLTDSKGDTLKTITYYPQDYSASAISGNFQFLLDINIIGVPVDQRQMVNAKLTSGKTTKYNASGQPIEIALANNELGSNLSFNSDNPYSYGKKEAEIQYDNITHNIQSFIPVDKQQVNYLWSYKNTYPVAEITGSSINIISNVLQQGGYSMSLLQESTNDTYITSATNYLRNNLQSALIISYTYDPQIGITSKTDASGISTTFEYDSSGRLLYIKDTDGNIVKKYDYHYATQVK